MSDPNGGAYEEEYAEHSLNHDQIVDDCEFCQMIGRGAPVAEPDATPSITICSITLGSEPVSRDRCEDCGKVCICPGPECYCLATTITADWTALLCDDCTDKRMEEL